MQHKNTIVTKKNSQREVPVKRQAKPKSKSPKIKKKRRKGESHHQPQRTS